MLSVDKLNRLSRQKQVAVEQIAEHLVRGGMNKKSSLSAVRNWKKGLFKPEPKSEDIRRLATALSVDVTDLMDWQSSYRYAPGSARKARLIAQLINGRGVQDALDVLKFTHKRAATMFVKVLKSAITNADEQRANMDNLYVSCARVDDAGLRIGTKTWIPKDRGRAHPIRKKACHLYVTVTEG